MELDKFILVSSILLLVSILVSKLFRRLGFPVLVGFLGIGMLAGSDGPGGIYFDDAQLAQAIGVLALAFILFSAGLDTPWRDVRPALKSALSLATLGVLLTSVVVGITAVFVLHFSWLEGLLLGAIIASTDAAAVFSVLRSRRLQLTGRLSQVLELESGTNDPMAVFLTVGVLQLLTHPAQQPLTLVLFFVQQMGIGLIVGLLLGKGAVLFIKYLHLEVEGLYPVASVALVLLTYGLTSFLGGSGFLAVYLLGMVLSNSALPLTFLPRFHDGVAWLMQITMFLVLGLLVFPARLPAVAIDGLLMAGCLMFVARPLGVLISLLFAKMTFREKLFIAWVGLRGAVPIVLATYPLLAGLPKAPFLFDLVFFIVLTSVLLQGTSLTVVARWLGVLSSPAETPGKEEASLTNS